MRSFESTVNRCIAAGLLAAALVCLVPAGATGVSPPEAPTIEDHPNDAGRALIVTWKIPSDAPPALQALLERMSEEGSRDTLEAVPAVDPQTRELGTTSLTDDDGLRTGNPYRYRLAWIDEGDTVWSAWSDPVAPKLQWFNTNRTTVAIGTVIFGILLVLFVMIARRGASLFIRRIPGLEAVEEAVGRATEMGRPILYCTGLDPMDEVATVASVNILGQVAKKAAEYETRLMVPHRDPIVMAVTQEVVREAHNEVGRPDTYNADDIFYTTYSQFGYAAAVCGFMMREKPATNFFIGRFYAESLVLAETGNATGAIQIAGTDADAQLPFFITSCDYTLIGEELYAGSVYLSREPLLLGALKGQDAAKAIIILILVAATVLLIAGVDVRPYLD
jgi:hypothetical protein